MPVETIGADDGVDALNEQWPNGSEPVKQGDDHIRNVKKAVKNQERINAAKNYGAIHENMLINGDFSVWQRGNSFTGFKYGCDRWVGYNAAVTREWSNLQGTVLKAIRSDQDDAALIVQPVELFQTEFGISIKPFTLNATYTLSAKVNTAGKLKPYIRYAKGAVDPTGEVTDTVFSYQTTDSDEVVTFTFTVDHPPATDDLCILVGFMGETKGVVYNFYSAKLEIGSVRTEHVPDSEQVNLAKCQRYFYKTPHPGVLGPGQVYGGSWGQLIGTVFIQFDFPVQMRIVPKIKTDGAGISAIRLDGVDNGFTAASQHPWTNMISGFLQCDGVAAYYCGQSTMAYSANGVEVDAEL